MPRVRNNGWLDPKPGTRIYNVLQTLLRPEGYIPDHAAPDYVSSWKPYLMDFCGYDIRIIGSIAVQIPGKKKSRRHIFRAIGRIPYFAEDTYEDYIAEAA